MLKATTHLHFDGRCKEALAAYAACLGGKISFSMTWGESPAAQQAPPAWADKIIHASLEFDGQTISADDAPPGNYSKPQGFSVMVSTPDLARAESIFKTLAAGGEVRMPFAKTFWSPGFGMAVDRFGIPWMVSCSQQEA
ncbi:MAG TPA: VOC family protein [Polyangiaceae bacterium]|jgi:PhnB protein